MAEQELRIAAGVDVGTECVKAAIASEDGQVIGRAVMPTRGYFNPRVRRSPRSTTRSWEEDLVGIGATGFGMTACRGDAHRYRAACHARLTR
jgi:activator of 2-hydroxyglutaryl-CoA dehydratase